MHVLTDQSTPTTATTKPEEGDEAKQTMPCLHTVQSTPTTATTKPEEGDEAKQTMPCLHTGQSTPTTATTKPEEGALLTKPKKPYYYRVLTPDDG